MKETIDYLHINPTPYVPQYSQLAGNYLVGYLLMNGKTGDIISTTHQSIEYILKKYNKEYLADELKKDINSLEDFTAYSKSKKKLAKILQQSYSNTNSKLLYDHNHIRYQSKISIETYSGMRKILDNPEQSIYYDYIQSSLIPDIVQKKPKVLGISIADKRQLEFVYCLISLLKKNTDNIKIGLGGYLPSVCMPDIIQDPLLGELLFQYIDFIVHNEGEIPLEKYIDYVDGKINIEEIPQLVYKDGAVIKSNSLNEEGRVLGEKMSTIKPNDIPSPYFPKEIKNQLFMPSGAVVGLLMSRGCPYVCSFCAIDKGYNRGAIVISEMINKNIDRKHANKKAEIIYTPEEDLVDHISKNYRDGTKIFSIVDESLSPTAINKIIIELENKKIHNCSFEYYTTLHKKYLEQDFCNKISKYGFIFPQFGLETISEKALLRSSKNQNLITLSDQEQILRNCWNAGIMPHVFLMIGLPDQTHTDLAKTISYLANIGDYILTIKPTTTKVAKYSQDSIYPENIGVELKKPKPFSANIPFEHQNNNKKEITRISQKSAQRRKMIFDLRIAIKHRYNFLTKELPYAHRLTLGKENIINITEEYYKNLENINDRDYDGLIFDLGKEKILDIFNHVFVEILKDNVSRDSSKIDLLILLIHGIYLSGGSKETIMNTMKPLVFGDVSFINTVLKKAGEGSNCETNDIIQYTKLLSLLEQIGDKL